MQKEYNSIKRQHKSSANSTVSKNASKKQNKVYLKNGKVIGVRVKNKSSLFLDSLRIIKIVASVLAIIIAFVIFVRFFLQFRTSLFVVCTCLVSIASSKRIQLLKKICEKHKVFKKFYNTYIVIISCMIKSLGKIINDYCRKYSFLTGIRSVVIFAFAISLIISIFPNLSVKAMSFIDESFKSVYSFVVEEIQEDQKTEQETELETEQETVINQNVVLDFYKELSFSPDMEFIIEHKDYSNMLTNDLITETYFYSTDNMLLFLKSIYNTRTPNQFMSAYYNAQKNQDSFTALVEVGKTYKSVNGQNEEWYNVLPTETELWKIIKEQEVNANEYPSYYIYEKISNNYQRLAIEYNNQKDNKDSIKYLYLMSIKCDIESIRFATKESEFNNALNRIIARFEDILFCCDCDESEILYLNSLIN